ncbi:dTMP kinase [Thermoproteota archaeon]
MIKINDYKGTWIVLEGGDGSGTSTALKKLHNWAYELHKSHLLVTTREPNEIDGAGKNIRRMFKGELDIGSTGQTLADLFVANRYSHMQNVVLPATELGLVVLQDRGMYSTIAYQGVQGVPHDQIMTMHEDMPAVPDAVILFDVDFEVAWERMQSRAEEQEEAFDKDPGFQRKVNDAYKALPEVMERLAPDHPINVIDANRTVLEVVAQCIDIIDPLLPYNKK